MTVFYHQHDRLPLELHVVLQRPDGTVDLARAPGLEPIVLGCKLTAAPVPGSACAAASQPAHPQPQQQAAPAPAAKKAKKTAPVVEDPDAPPPDA